MGIVVNFELNGDAWIIHCTPETARALISPAVRGEEPDTLIRLFRYVGAKDAGIEQVNHRILLGNKTFSISDSHGAKVS